MVDSGCPLVLVFILEPLLDIADVAINKADVFQSLSVGSTGLIAALILEPLLDIAEVALEKADVSHALNFASIGLRHSYSKFDGV